MRNELALAPSRWYRGTAEIVRSILFQGAIKADDEVKREFLFLSLLREQPAFAWIGFGFPDGRFFGSHAAPDGKIEMVEIGSSARPARRDHCAATSIMPIPGDVFFEERIKAETAYVPGGAAWYRKGKDTHRTGLDRRRHLAERFRALGRRFQAGRALRAIRRRRHGGGQPEAAAADAARTST